MKKFYALAAALMATGSMLATNPAAIKPEARQSAAEMATMSEEGLAMFRAEQAYEQYVADNAIEVPGMQKFSWTDSNGETWNVRMYESGQWSDNFTSWDGAQYYAKVICQISNGKSQSQQKLINHVMFAPRYCMWNESAWAQLFPGEEAAADKMIPLKYLMKTSDIMTNNWPVGWWVPKNTGEANSFYIGQTSSTGGDKADALVIMNPNTPSSSGPYFSSTTSMGYSVYNGTRCGCAQGSNLALSNYDNETYSIDMAFKGTCTNASGATVWTYDLPFSGVAFMPGIGEQPVDWTATSVHVANTGSVTGEDENYMNLDDTEWGPFQRFYLFACGEGYTYDDVELQGGGTLWGTTTLPEGPARMSSDAPAMKDLHGALFSANNAADINNIWKEANVEVGFDSYGNGLTTGKPTVNSFLDGGWNSNYWSWSETDGVRMTYEGMYFFAHYAAETAKTYDPFVMIGTTDGMGYKGFSTYHCNITMRYKGDIVYHYDPTDYKKTRKVAAVGTLTPPTAWTSGVSSIFTDNSANNFNVNAANGMINVTVEDDAVVNVYNMAGMIVKSVNAKAGQTVNVDAANGIYVVKVNGKAVKVAF